MPAISESGWMQDVLHGQSTMDIEILADSE